jgi:hypothetical protein
MARQSAGRALIAMAFLTRSSSSGTTGLERLPWSGSIYLRESLPFLLYRTVVFQYVSVDYPWASPLPIFSLLLLKSEDHKFCLTPRNCCHRVPADESAVDQPFNCFGRQRGPGSPCQEVRIFADPLRRPARRPLVGRSVQMRPLVNCRFLGCLRLPIVLTLPFGYGHKIRASRNMRILVTLLCVALCSLRAHAQGAPGPTDPKEIISNWWAKKPKWYLIITASNPHWNLYEPISWVDKDGDNVKRILESFRYRPLHDPLVGDDASTSKVGDAIESIHNGHGKNDIIVVYFSGHGHRGPQDTDLHLILNSTSDMLLSDWVRAARGGTADNPSYQGELVFIVDACDSGNGVWRTSLTLRDFQLPIAVLASSSVDQLSRKLKDKDASAFTSVFERGTTTDWSGADDNNDGFLEYRELRQFEENELAKLATAKKIDVAMHPEGYTDQPLFIFYDKTKDHNLQSSMHKRLITEHIIPDYVSTAVTQLNVRNGSLLAPTLPPEMRVLASSVEDSGDLPPLAQGYKALAEGRFGEAKDLFTRAKSAARDIQSPYAMASANVALARAEVLSGSSARASYYYAAGGAYLNVSGSELVAETGANLVRSGDIQRGIDLLSFAYRTGSTALDPQEVLGLDPLVVTQSLAIAFAIGGRGADAKEPLAASIEHSQSALAESVSASGKLSKSKSVFDVRVAALTYANAAAINDLDGDQKTALHLYKQSAALFDQIQDDTNEYATMLGSYSEALSNANKPALANTVLQKADAIKSEIK